MAVEKVGVYRRWLEPAKKDGKPIPKTQWPKKRRYSWIVRWYGTTGKRFSKDFKTKKLADRYAQDLQDQVKRGKQDRPEKVTLHEFIEEHKQIMKGQVAYATLSDQRRALEQFEKFIGVPILLTKIRPRDAEAFIAHRLSTVPSIATANKDIRTLRSIFNLAIEPRGYLAEGQNPFVKIKERKITDNEIRYVTVKEYFNFSFPHSNKKSLFWKDVRQIIYPEL